MQRLRIGTRGSKLALAQAHEVKMRLCRALGYDESEIEIVTIVTTGDRVKDRPLAEIGGKGLFTKEIEEALLNDAVDLAVHSMKDMPAVLPRGLVISTLLPREDARDAFLSPVADSIAGLPPGAVVGSSSVRRSAQLKRIRPDVLTVQFRGNVDTRLRKLDEGVAQATFLACAGLNRLGLAHRITAPVSINEMLPAVAQGAVGIEIHEANDKIRSLLDHIHDRTTEIAVTCERAFLAALDGSCRTPLAGYAEVSDGQVSFRGQALSLDGVHCFEATRTGPIADAGRLGRDAGEEVKALGGALIAS